ncbi:hypothetical protein GCM10010207_35390 [Streptomyces atratus]|nr:hypothetical protein GCM10010207_35390 [Streptomyces atratus]
MRGTARARDSIAHDMGFAGGWTGSRGPCSGTGADDAASCTDVICSPFRGPVNTLTNQPTWGVWMTSL